MKSKFRFFAMAVLMIAMTLGLASAALSASGIPSELSQESSSFTINVIGNESESVNVHIEDIVNNQILSVDFSFPGVLTLDENGTAQAVINYTVQEEFELTKDYSTTLRLNGTDSGEKTYNLNFEETDYCLNVDNRAGIDLEIEDVNVISGYGDENDYWYLMDEIEVEVLIEPRNYDIEDVEIEWVLYTTDGVKIDDGDSSVSDIDRRDEETTTFTFKLDSSIDDFDREDAILYVRAIGYIDDRDSSYDGNKSCSSERIDADVNTRDDFVIVTDLKFTDGVGFDSNDIAFDEYNVISCDEQVSFTGEIWNIGEDDQDDIRIEIYSRGLEVYEELEYNSIDAFDSEDFTYTFEVPSDLEANVYPLTIEVFDEDNDLFENEEDDESIKTILFQIEESCVIEDPTVTAEIIGESEAGEEITVKTYIRNNNNRDADFIITTEGLESWATLSNIEPRMFTLGAGEAKEVEITFVAKKDSVGEHTFEIKTLIDGDNEFSQPASINVEEGAFDIQDYMTKENLQIGAIVLLNLILLIAIIVVARKILKKK